MSDPNAIEEQVKRAQAAVYLGVITREELARRAGLRSTTIATMLDAEWNPTRNTLSKIVEVLDAIGFFIKAARSGARAA
jgi:predicted transcriptional regulator